MLPQKFSAATTFNRAADVVGAAAVEHAVHAAAIARAAHLISRTRYMKTVVICISPVVCHACAMGDEAALLKTAGLKATAQRLAILRHIADRDRPSTAQEVHVELRRSGGAPGLVTIYRTLAALADAGVLDTFDLGGEKGFRLCRDAHHHHLVCESCGAVEEVDGGEIEAWVKRTGRRRGFAVTSHRAEIYGLCRNCH
jgi:Fur family ferric uptake transcriptional regulator